MMMKLLLACMMVSMSMAHKLRDFDPFDYLFVNETGIERVVWMWDHFNRFANHSLNAMKHMQDPHINGVHAPACTQLTDSSDCDVTGNQQICFVYGCGPCTSDAQCDAKTGGTTCDVPTGVCS
jgi:hypothetical protein